ncbi:M16 family metallopeptidase [Luteolibacter luteus]|uniref:Insulinase family protein n=1 Tax=Luteolibacter luteus TaxID=2728835 RepID=A0A858RJY4_9BACT|nr:pitrilysin family protein [Luteolibacter luteus]QJE97237.1 insulinase family protein [Luteolibacter luteus]
MDYPATAATLDSLPNGLTLILDPDPAAPVVSSQLWVETGSLHEGSLLGSGISHFLEHMVFKGGGRFGADELATTVQGAGGHWNAYTTFDRTVYYIDGPASGLETFLEVQAAMIFAPLIPEEEFEKEKDVIRREIDMGLDDPDDVASRLMFSTAFTADPRRHPVIGHRGLFDAITYADLTGYHRRRYTPDRCCLCISGDFDAAEVREKIEALFGGFVRGSGAEPVVPEDGVQLGPRRGRATFAVPASRVTLAWKIPPLGHPDVPAYELAAAVLGRGRSARLYRRLREERELALEISAWSWSQAGRDGIFAVSAEAEPEKRDELIAAILAELEELPSSAIDDELAKARRQIAASQFKTLTSASGRASDLASNWHEARDLDFTRRYLAALNATTAADVRRAVGKLTEDQLTISILDPEEAPAPAALKPASRHRPEPECITLPNGATLALLPDPRVPILTAQVAVRAGLVSETEATSGLNTLLASTLPQGTIRHSAAELAGRLESLGATLGAATGNNALLVQLSGLSPDVPVLLPLLAEVLAEPAFHGDSIEREKASQLASLRESLEDPLSTAFRLARHHLFKGQGYGLPALGTEESLANLNRLALSAHHSRHFQGRNLVIALAGDFDISEAKDLLAEGIGRLPEGSPWLPPAATTASDFEIEAYLPKKQAVLALAYPGCSALAPERFALRMIQEWCSDMAGPLFTRIREDLGLAYQVGATQFHGHDTGLFGFYMATDPSQVELAQAELSSEIAKIANNGIPEEAFERVRATVLSSLALGMQAPASIARLAAIDVLFGLPVTHHREAAGIFQKLSPGDVKSAAGALLEKAPVTVRVLPRE